MRAPSADAGPRVAGRTPAAMLLRGRTALGLSAEQVTRLEALAASQATTLVPPTAAALRARADLIDATRGDGDLSAARRAMERMQQLRLEMMLARLKARQEARALLSAEQKTKLVALEQERRGRGIRAGRGARGAGRGPMRTPGRGGMRDGMWREGPPQRPLDD